MLGGGHAASYEIIASELPVGAPCTEPLHTTTSVSHDNMHLTFVMTCEFRAY